MATLNGQNSVWGVPDTLVGAASDDTIDGKGGGDKIDGAAGNDTAVFFDHKINFATYTLAGITHVRALPDANTQYYWSSYPNDAVLTNVENIAFIDGNVSTGTSPNTSFIVGQNSVWGVAETLVGTADDDTLDGRGGGDKIDGGAGNDTAVFFDSQSKFATYTLAGITHVTALPGANPQYYNTYSKVDAILTNVETIQFTDQSISVAVDDIISPTVTTFSPSDEAVQVAIVSNIAVTFSEAIQRGSGTITLKTSTGASIAIYDAAVSTNITFSGSTLVINPSADLAYGTGYKVEFASGSVKDDTGNAYDGTTGYNFTTAARVNIAPTGTVTISGDATQGQTLTAANTITDIDGIPAAGSTGAIAYQWQAGGVDISGATSDKFTLTQSEVGKTISVKASYTDNFSQAESVSSSVTAAVANVNDVPTGSVTIIGTATQGQTLTASNTLTDADGVGAISYQWQADSTVITGAVASTFLVTDAQVGKSMTVVASYTDGHGTAESVSSSAVLVAVGKGVDLLAYSWKAHTQLDGVNVSAGTHSGTTDATGTISFTAITDPSLTLTTSRAVPTAEASATSSAVNLQDAIAILKMIVGLPVNGANQALSPYQALAADFDCNGTVGLTDAIGVLKHVVGLPSPEPAWHFVNATDPGLATISISPLAPGNPPVITADLSGTSPVHVVLVGYLSGDVDGSYA